MASSGNDSAPDALPPGEGEIVDYISGSVVRASPEQTDAIQPLSRLLVEAYGYSKKQIQTWPQFRVKESPSGTERYPVDMVVFKSEQQTYDNVLMVVEAKAKTQQDGKRQLDLYLNMVPSVEIGVWYNGRGHLYLRKVPGKTAPWDWEEIPDLPRKGQRVEDVGLFKRSSLRTPMTLIAEFRDMRNYLAGNATGITRDAQIAEQIIYLLFCKIYDEKNKGPDELVEFRAGTNERPEDVKARIVDLFERVKDRRRGGYEDVFEKTDKVRLDPKSVVYIVGLLQRHLITGAARDAVGEAFETIIGPALRGEEGQFFTPRNVVGLAVDMIDPKPNEYIIDPACGSGGFLTVTLEHVWQQIETSGRSKGFSDLDIGERKRSAATSFLLGIEKDSFLSKITKSYMAIMGDGRGGVFCENSLVRPAEWSRECQLRVSLGQFDVVLTNPPFGAKIPVEGESILAQYELGHVWKRDKKGALQKTSRLHSSQPPQILFIERCLQLLAAGGRMAIVLPEGILGNASEAYVRQFVRDNANVVAVVDCPLETFLPSCPTKVALLVLQKKRTPDDKQGPVFMAIAEKCGHDRRGVPVLTVDGKPDDDFPEVAQAFSEFRRVHNVLF